MNYIFLTALLLLASINTVIAAGDSVAGKSKIILCIGCHGSDGNSDNPAYPKLAGQGEAYWRNRFQILKPVLARKSI